MRSKNLRARARRKLWKLLSKQKNLCHWCGDEIIDLKSVTGKIIRVNRTHVLFEQDGVQFQKKLATVDHIVEIKNGGTNNKDNIVAACNPCNQNRSREPPRIPRGICKHCSAKIDPSSRYCKYCKFGMYAVPYALNMITPKEIAERWRAKHDSN